MRLIFMNFIKNKKYIFRKYMHKVYLSIPSITYPEPKKPQ